MPLWTKEDSLNGAPKWKSIATGSGTPNRGNTLFGNVTSGAFINNETIGVFGANNTEAAAFPGNGTPGWIKTTVGTGPVLTVAVSGGTGFVNGSTLTISNGTSTATAVVTSNINGNAASAVVTTPGSGFIAQLAGPGTVTTTLSSNQITGVGTNFVVGLVGRQVYTTGNVYIGTITATPSTTTANLAVNALVALSGAGYRIGQAVATFTRERFVNTIANSTGGIALGHLQGGVNYVNGNIITITGGVTAIANLTGGTGISRFDIPGAVGYVNNNIITISGPRFAVNAVANISSTNATGGNVTFTFINRGSLVNGTVNQAFTYAISNTGLGGGLLGNTSVSIFGNSIVQTVLAPAVINVSTNATGGNLQLSVVGGGGVFLNTAENAAFTYIITQGTGTTLGNTSVTQFANAIIAGNSGGGVINAITLGGAAGRISREPLVVFRGMTGTGSSSP